MHLTLRINKRLHALLTHRSAPIDPAYDAIERAGTVVA